MIWKTREVWRHQGGDNCRYCLLDAARPRKVHDLLKIFRVTVAAALASHVDDDFHNRAGRLLIARPRGVAVTRIAYCSGISETPVTFFTGTLSSPMPRIVSPFSTNTRSATPVTLF